MTPVASKIFVLFLIGILWNACSNSTGTFDEPTSLLDKPSSSEVHGSSSSAIISSSDAAESSTDIIVSSDAAESSSSSEAEQMLSSSSDIAQDDPKPMSSFSIDELMSIYNEDPRKKNYRLLYPRNDGVIDTAFFPFDECQINNNGTFVCTQNLCWPEIGGKIKVDIGGIEVSLSVAQKDHPSYSEFFHSSNDKNLLIDLNLGDNPLTHYIPYANIPEILQRGMKGKFSKLPSASCSALKKVTEPYLFQAIGLPEGMILYCDSNHTDYTSTNEEPYALLFPEDKLEKVQASILNETWWDSLWAALDRDEYLWDTFDHDEIHWLDSLYFEPIDHNTSERTDFQRKASINAFGCGELSYTYNLKITQYGSCKGWRLPEEAKEYNCRLLNTSGNKPPDTVYWTLVYKDQHNRSGTLDLRSTFK